MSLPAAVSEKLDALKAAAPAWREMPAQRRAAVARACRGQLATVDTAWVEDNMRCLGIEPSRRDAYNTLTFDPFLFFSATGERLDKVAAALEGTLKIPTPQPLAEGGEDVQGPRTQVYKMGPVSQGAPGCELELWTDSDVPPSEPASADGASIVLGAGNQNFLTSVDVIERAFMHKECVYLKHHPIRPFMAEVFAHIFAPLAEAGAYAQGVDADIDGQNAAFVTHPAVTHIHITGSGATHDRIITTLKDAGREDVGFTSELGCITPWIVCPGSGVWSDTDMTHHAKMLTSAFKSSCSMNCLSPKVLVLPSAEVWPQREAFLAGLRRELASAPQPVPYYPGAHQRFAAFEAAYPSAEKISAPAAQENQLPATYPGQDFGLLPSLLVDVGILGSSEEALQKEAFAPVLAIGTVECDGPASFPLAAARAVNQHVFGTLSANVMYPGARDSILDAAVAELNYGVVSINMWAALGYSQPLSVWGGAPGSYSKEQPESGLDFIGNVAGVPNVRKGVLVSPFVNKGVAMDKVMPMLVADSLTTLVSGKKFAFPRVLGNMCVRGFGLIPRKMPKPSSQEEAAQRRCFGR